jgi:hypothetical protein
LPPEDKKSPWKAGFTPGGTYATLLECRLPHEGKLLEGRIYISLRDRLPLGRQAIFIETGYLIEGRLPPWKAGSLWQ